jgi:glycosyltransferase involved in cell wall biosynthesis
MNFNIVTSNHAKSVFEEPLYQKPAAPNQSPIILKSIKPIEVLFWGADTSIYGNDKSFEPRIEEELSVIKEDFCFLFVGQWTSGGLFNDRKDIGNLIKTFLITFSNMGPKRKPALVIKTNGAAICNMDKHDMINRLKSVRSIVEQEKNTKDLPNVYILYGELTESEMNALYNHPKIKAHISFTHGEGFGLPLLLSTLSGKPVLASNWSGHLDFLDSKFCKLLHGEIKKIPEDCANEWLIKESSWFTVDYPKAMESMRNCFNFYKAFLEKAEQLRKKNVEEFSIQAMDKRFYELLEKYVPKFATEQKLILPKLKKIELPKLKPINPPSPITSSSSEATNSVTSSVL